MLGISTYQTNDPSIVTSLSGFLQRVRDPLSPLEFSTEADHGFSPPSLCFRIKCRSFRFHSFGLADFRESSFRGTQWSWRGEVVQVGCKSRGSQIFLIVSGYNDFGGNI